MGLGCDKKSAAAWCAELQGVYAVFEHDAEFSGEGEEDDGAVAGVVG